MKRYLETVVLGPGSSGFVKVAAGYDNERFVTDVPVDRLPQHLRLPNAEFFAVFEGRDLIAVLPSSEGIDLYRNVRRVLNQYWDPIGISSGVADEYDGYIPDIINLLRSSASNDVIAEYLHQIEVDRMALPGRSVDDLREVAIRLRDLEDV